MTTCLPLVVLLLASACTPVSMIDRKIEVSAAQFQDLAVPAGFRIVDRHHESHSLSLGRYRFGVYRYLGSASVDSSVSYVEDRMRQQRWSLIERDGQGTDAQRLIFETQSEGVEYRMEYRVRRQESRTLIDVDVRTNAPPIAKG